jgi:hypothetical protein
MRRLRNTDDPRLHNGVQWYTERANVLRPNPEPGT